MFLFSANAEVDYTLLFRFATAVAGRIILLSRKRTIPRKRSGGECKQIPPEPPIFMRHAPLRAQCRMEHYIIPYPRHCAHYGSRGERNKQQKEFNMIRAILFDFDGVLTIDKTGSRSVLNYISNATGIPFDTLKTEYYKYNNRLLNGQLTHREMWEDFCKSIGLNIAYSVLIDSFRHTPLDHEMLDLVKELKVKYKIGMITDNKCDRINEILSYYKLSDMFDIVSVSAEYKSGKESAYIFNKTAEKLSVAPTECVFVDNTAKNLIAAKQLGMKTILFDDENRDIYKFKMQLYDIIKSLQ